MNCNSVACINVQLYNYMASYLNYGLRDFYVYAMSLRYVICAKYFNCAHHHAACRPMVTTNDIITARINSIYAPINMMNRCSECKAMSDERTKITKRLLLNINIVSSRHMLSKTPRVIHIISSRHIFHAQCKQLHTNMFIAYWWLEKNYYNMIYTLNEDWQRNDVTQWLGMCHVTSTITGRKTRTSRDVSIQWVQYSWSVGRGVHTWARDVIDTGSVWTHLSIIHDIY